jgi:hypothetical protein|eukprot:COSAG02_NODE_5517_length_4266_cov_4.582193_3_plen_81_part_00
MLVWALGAAPSKDTFWTNNQSSIAKVHAPECGGASGCPPDHTDAGCELHSMLAALSTGKCARLPYIPYCTGTKVNKATSG